MNLPVSGDPVDYCPDTEGPWDVIVIGGGPAGATTAALTAEYGHRVLLLERSTVPRFHVGESLIPETWWTLQRLGLIEQMKQSAFPRKYSVQFVSDGFRESAPFYFDEHRPQESSVTWQVVRSEFDRMILERARELGAAVHTSAHVTDVLFENDRAVGVQAQIRRQGDTQRVRLAASVVVDATGQSAFLSSRRKDRHRDPRLLKASIWGYFRGARRDRGRDEGATLIMQTPEKKSWFWYIPLPDDIVSVGCTADLSFLFGPQHGTAADVFARELKRCPAMQERLARAERLGEFLTTKDFSWSSGQGAGHGWVLVGDAFGFIDPVYSSGVYLALKSGEFAADAIHEALSDSDLSAERLGHWQPMYRRGVDSFRRLVYAFYTPGFSFATFLKEHPEYHSSLVDILIGDVFRPGLEDMFDAMQPEQPAPSG